MNDGIVTTELRWFHDGELPTELSEWLASDALSPYAPASRSAEDHYLWTGRDDLSLKLRGSDLERKERLARSRLSHAGAEGWAERWEKSSRAKEPDDDVRSLITIAHKRRRSLLFTDQRSRLAPLEETDTTPPLVLELAALHVPGRHAWSLCLEANQGYEALLDPLLAHVMQSFPSACRDALTAEHSVGYAAWLARHGKQPRMSEDEAQQALPTFS